MSRLTRDGTAESVSRDQILRHARGQGNVHFPCSADHGQDWQPYPVDPYSAICDDHTYIHTYILLKGVELLILRPTRHTSAHVKFCRGSVLSTAERSRVTYFTTDKAHERAAVSQGGVGKRWKNHGVFLRYSYSSGLILPLLASDTPVLALDVLRA